MLIKMSKEILQELKKTGLVLTEQQKLIIIEKVYDLAVSSYAEGKRIKDTGNGCDCGQPSCRYCN